MIAGRSLRTPQAIWDAWSARGYKYVIHKGLRRLLPSRSMLKRALVYGDPREYWTLRGGPEYCAEQEGQRARTLRAEWIAERVVELRPESVLEVGCGYGKLLGAMRERTGARLVGLDFSPTQLELARARLSGARAIDLIHGSGDRLPFADRSFDVVVTSAVILHNPPAIADRMRSEIVRVARGHAVHSEELGRSYNRFGYDTAAWYRERGICVLESGSLPRDCCSDDSERTQFCVAAPWRRR